MCVCLALGLGLNANFACTEPFVNVSGVGGTASGGAALAGGRAALATLSDTASIQGTTSARSGTFAVARASNGGLTFFKGGLDELAVYARVLTLGEISKHFELGVRP